MEFVKEGYALVHRNEAGEIDAEITYQENTPGVLDVDHTFVSPTLRGQGVAKKLVDAIADFARNENKKLKAVCPYVVTLFEKSTEYDDLKA